ncbi:hypothetical protein GCM10007860_30920 [Chitiniphilus shinanonensis]|uniref:Zorya protein ZorC EH domain-containing protein n=1 Tax=Chitiniphilus shinanonensis TaxID=553088 RepID=A0ABQ6BWP9_9NEIS|nr:hypothetical protein [Chitiniphilus shinanonensis]GLS05929.1 hypothetical protein GCM10007860_30920 [Chitiniphilus shinanonensis]
MFDFKGLITALFSREQQQGVHDYKSATVMMQELPESDILQAHIEIVKALRQLNSNPRISLKERMRTVPYLDEKARSLQDHLIEVYSGSLIDDHAAPHQVLPSILAYWHQMAEAYRLCIKQALQSGTRHLEQQLHLFIVRALLHYNQEVKWGYLRYMEIDGRVWRNLNRVYHYAEHLKLITTPVQPYPEAELTDARREYIQPLMLSLSMPDKLQPSQIELVWHWLRRWAGRIELELQIRPNRQLFAVNIAGSTPPKRLRRDMVGDNWRYWFTEALVQHARDVHDQLERGAKPEAHGLPIETADPAHLELMHKLLNLWSRDIAPPVRRFERQDIRKRVQVVRGLDDVIRFLGGHGSGSHRLIDSEHWVLENESSGGYGMNYTGKGDDKLLVGELVGLGQTEGRSFTVGIIRRITKHRDGHVHVGVERLSANAVVVELSQMQGDRTFQGLYTTEGTGSTDRFLMLPQTFFAPHREFLLSAQGRRYRIRMDPALEHSGHTAIARFSVLERLESAPRQPAAPHSANGATHTNGNALNGHAAKAPGVNGTGNHGATGGTVPRPVQPRPATDAGLNGHAPRPQGNAMPDTGPMLH